MYDRAFKLQSIQLGDKLDLSHKKTIFQQLAKREAVETIVLYYSTEKFSLMPRRLFLYGKEKSYLKHVCPILSSEIVFTDQCDAEQIINIYGIPLVEDFAVRQALNGVRTKHIMSEFISNTTLKMEYVYIYVLCDKLHVYYNGENLPKLVSIYQWNNWEDILYKMQELNNHFDLPDNKLILCGNLDTEDDTYRFLREKKPAISLFSENREINLSFILNT